MTPQPDELLTLLIGIGIGLTVATIIQAIFILAAMRRRRR